MRMKMILGVQGEFGQTLMPGESYEIGKDLTEKFARQLLFREVGYLEDGENLEPAKGPMTIENSLESVNPSKKTR